MYGSSTRVMDVEMTDANGSSSLFGVPPPKGGGFYAPFGSIFRLFGSPASKRSPASQPARKHQQNVVTPPSSSSPLSPPCCYSPLALEPLRTPAVTPRIVPKLDGGEGGHHFQGRKNSSWRGEPSPPSRSQSRFEGQAAGKHWIQQLPSFIMSYMQMLFNVGLICMLFWGFAAFCFAVRADIDSKLLVHSNELLEKTSRCSRSYVENRCAPGERVPALDSSCREWEACMSQDTGIVVKRSKLSAQTLGEVVNAFLEQLSWKSAALLSLLFLVVVVGSNFALSMARQQQQPRSRLLTKGQADPCYASDTSTPMYQPPVHPQYLVRRGDPLRVSWG